MDELSRERQWVADDIAALCHYAFLARCVASNIEGGGSTSLQKSRREALRCYRVLTFQAIRRLLRCGIRKQTLRCILDTQRAHRG